MKAIIRSLFYVVLILVLLLINNNLIIAQTTLKLRPGPNNAKSAVLFSIDPNTNYSGSASDDFIGAAWTYNGTQGVDRSLMEFDLSSIPSTATVVSAKLSLYYDPYSSWGGQSGNNAALLERVTSSWDASTVTYNTQPSTSTLDEVLLPQSTSSNQNYVNMDVTSLVQDMVSYPSSSYGFYIQEQVETPYCAMKFASAFVGDSTLYPELDITFMDSSKIKCNTIVSSAPIDNAAILFSINPNTNYSGSNGNDFIAAAWTYNGNAGVDRSLMQVDLSSIPPGMKIQSAALSLFYDANSSWGGQSGNNAALLQRITSSWDPTTVTYNNSPSTTTNNEVILPQSTSSNEDYLNVDVTGMVQDMIDSPFNSYGFYIQEQTEIVYCAMKFCSPTNSDSLLRPQLTICYIDSVSGINIQSTLTKQDLFLFPNPCSNELKMSFTLNSPSWVNITINDLLGRSLKELRILNLSGKQQLYLSSEIGDLTSGMYLITLSTKNNISTQSFIKN